MGERAQRPRTGKSCFVFVFALRACVRACEAVRGSESQAFQGLGSLAGAPPTPLKTVDSPPGNGSPLPPNPPITLAWLYGYNYICINSLPFFSSLLASSRNFIHTSHSTTFLETPQQLTFSTPKKKATKNKYYLFLVMLENGRMKK